MGARYYIIDHIGPGVTSGPTLRRYLMVGPHAMRRSMMDVHAEELRRDVEAGVVIDPFYYAMLGVSHDQLQEAIERIRDDAADRSRAEAEERLRVAERTKISALQASMAWRDAQRQKNQPWYLRNPK